MMKKNTFARRDIIKDDKGFSLVEVIVAMTILVIVSLPLISSISSSFVINRNAREYQRGNNISQNIVEACKSYGVYDIRNQFSKYNESGQVSDLKIINGYEFASASECIIDGTGNYIQNKTTGDMEENYFVIKKLKDGVNYYDVLVTSKLKAGNEKSKSIVNLGGANVMVVDNFGNTAVSDGSKNYYEKVVETVRLNVPSVTDSDLREKIQCDLVVDIKESSTGVELKATANYKSIGNILGYSLNESFLVSFYDLANPEYLYLLYTPCSASDTVKINNDVNKKMDLFIVPTSYDDVTWPANFSVDFNSVYDINDIFNIHASSTSEIRNYASLAAYIKDFDSINNSLYDIKVQTYQHTADEDEMFKTRLISTFDSTVFGKN